MVAGFMFGHTINDYQSYRLLGVLKNGVVYTGTYYRNFSEREETITATLSGEVFYSIKDFVLSVNGLSSQDEWMECLFYAEPLHTDDEEPELIYEGGWFPIGLFLRSDSTYFGR